MITTSTERVLPRLPLDWTSGLAQQGVNVVRAGVATFVGSNGLIQSASANTQRLDWTTGISGLLVEETRTNLALYSEQYDVVAIWLLTRVTVNANQITSPDGTMNGDKVLETATTGSHVVFQSIAVTNGSTNTFTVYAKAGERNELGVRANTDGTATASVFDLNAGIILSTGAGYTSTITNANNGWYRCSVTSIAGGVSMVVAASLRNNGSTYLGDPTKGLFVWGAQLEAGASPTSYIPTVATAVTRNADVATMTGTNFSSFWQGIIGGAMVQAIQSTLSGIRPLVQYDDGTANNIIALRGNTTNPELQIVTGGAPQAQIDAGTIAANAPYSLTGWWSFNDCRARKDAGAVVIDNTATIPTVTQARLGSDGTNYLNGHLMMVNYYDRFSSQIYTRRKNKAVFQLL